MSHFASMAVRCLRLRNELSPELWPLFIPVEEAALKHAISQDAANVGAPEPDYEPLGEYPALTLVEGS